jgi:hypothetical protein
MEFTTSLLIESWILYALGVAMVICRLISRRIKLQKWSSLMIDDYLMIFALVRLRLSYIQPASPARRALHCRI